MRAIKTGRINYGTKDIIIPLEAEAKVPSTLKKLNIRLESR